MSEDIGFVLRTDNPGTGEGYTHLGTPGGQTCISILGVPQRASTFQVSLVLVTYFTYYGESYVFQYPYNFSMSVVTMHGCTDPDACNYQPTAVEDDGSCGVFDECGVCAGLGIPEGECDCDGNVVDAVGVCGGDCPSDFNANGICDSDEVFGCTYESAENYDPEATSDDGTCVGFEGANVSSCLFDGDGNGGVGSIWKCLRLKDSPQSCFERVYKSCVWQQNWQPDFPGFRPAETLASTTKKAPEMGGF